MFWTLLGAICVATHPDYKLCFTRSLTPPVCLSVCLPPSQGTTDNAGDDEGEMGDNLPAVPLTGTVTAIAAGCDFTCALMGDGAVMCW